LTSRVWIYILAVASIDIAVSTIIAISIERFPRIKNLQTIYGYGCHPDPDKAIIRALTEVTQGKITFQDLKINDEVPIIASWQSILNLDIQPHLKKAQAYSFHLLPVYQTMI